MYTHFCYHFSNFSSRWVEFFSEDTATLGLVFCLVLALKFAAQRFIVCMFNFAVYISFILLSCFPRFCFIFPRNSNCSNRISVNFLANRQIELNKYSESCCVF